MPKRKLDWQNAADLYEAGNSIGDIATQLDVDPTTVWNALKQQGVARRPRRKDRNIPDEIFLDVVASVQSIYGVIRALGMSPGKHSYRWVKEVLERLQPDVSHWTRRTTKKPHPLEHYLCEDSTFTGSTSGLRKRLLRKGYVDNQCCLCMISTWQGKPLTVQLDHINGNPKDNRLENLRMLCPNCHSQTPTFSGRSRI